MLLLTILPCPRAELSSVQPEGLRGKGFCMPLLCLDCDGLKKPTAQVKRANLISQLQWNKGHCHNQVQQRQRNVLVSLCVSFSHAHTCACILSPSSNMQLAQEAPTRLAQSWLYWENSLVEEERLMPVLQPLDAGSIILVSDVCVVCWRVTGWISLT